MKPVLVLTTIGIVAILVIAVSKNVAVEDYVKPTIVTEQVEVTPDWAQDEEAVAAAQAVIRKKELESELIALDKDWASTTAMYETEKETYTAKRKEIQAELNSYWTVRANLKSEVRKTFPEDPVVAVAVADAESQYNVYAYNPEWHKDSNGNKICQGSFGLMQIACVHVKDTSKLYDPEYNLKIARQIYEDSKWQPWGAYTDGRYKLYLAMR